MNSYQIDTHAIFWIWRCVNFLTLDTTSQMCQIKIVYRSAHLHVSLHLPVSLKPLTNIIITLAGERIGPGRQPSRSFQKPTIV